MSEFGDSTWDVTFTLLWHPANSQDGRLSSQYHSDGLKQSAFFTFGGTNEVQACEIEQ